MAISQFIAIACNKLRKQNSKAQGMYIFVQTNLHKAKPYSNGIFCSFETPTLDTRLMIGAGKHYLKKIYLQGLNYKKAGIMLVNLIDSHICQEDLFIKNSLSNKSEHLMHALDKINERLGRNSVFIAAEGVQHQNRQWPSLLKFSIQEGHFSCMRRKPEKSAKNFLPKKIIFLLCTLPPKL